MGIGFNNTPPENTEQSPELQSNESVLTSKKDETELDNPFESDIPELAQASTAQTESLPNELSDMNVGELKPIDTVIKAEPEIQDLKDEVVQATNINNIAEPTMVKTDQDKSWAQISEELKTGSFEKPTEASTTINTPQPQSLPDIEKLEPAKTMPSPNVDVPNAHVENVILPQGSMQQASPMVKTDQDKSWDQISEELKTGLSEKPTEASTTINTPQPQSLPGIEKLEPAKTMPSPYVDISKAHVKNVILPQESMQQNSAIAESMSKEGKPIIVTAKSEEEQKLDNIKNMSLDSFTFERSKVPTVGSQSPLLQGSQTSMQTEVHTNGQIQGVDAVSLNLDRNVVEDNTIQNMRAELAESSGKSEDAISINQVNNAQGQGR